MIWDLFEIVDCEDKRLIGSLVDKAKFTERWGGGECYIILGEPAQTMVRCGFKPYDARMTDLCRAAFIFPDEEKVEVKAVSFEVS